MVCAAMYCLIVVSFLETMAFVRDAIDERWSGPYQGLSKTRAYLMLNIFEA